MRDALIPQVFPFSIEEIRAAAERWLPREEVDDFVEHFGETVRFSLERYATRSARRREAGHEAREYFIDFDIPDVLLAYLTLVSASAAERVDRLMRERWSETLEREIETERRRAAERAGTIPTIDDLLDDAERRGEFSWDEPRFFLGMAMSGGRLPEPPPATEEVIAVAETYVAEDVAAWEQLLVAVRTGGPLPPDRWHAISDGDEAWSEGELPGLEPDWPFIDDYIAREDRWRRGESRLFRSLAGDLPRFNGELVRALRLAPQQAVPRTIVYHLIQGHNRPAKLASPVGHALSAALGENTPRRTREREGEFYLSADLLEWLEANRGEYESYPLFDEWRARKRTRREIAWMRMVRDRGDELQRMMKEMFDDSAPDAHDE